MKIGVVIQGKVSDASILKRNIKNLKLYFDTEDIVVSTWIETDQVLVSYQNMFLDRRGRFFGIPTIRSDMNTFEPFKEVFAIVNGGNLVYQCFSTVAAINHLRSLGCTHVIKIRTDEYYTDFEPLIEEMKTDNRIHSCSLFFRKDFPYHIGDHLVAGPIDDMHLLFNTSLSYAHSILTSERAELWHNEVLERKWAKRIWNNVDSELAKLVNLTHTDIPPEVKLCAEYISTKEKRPIHAKEHVELIKRYFKVFDVRNLREFYFKSNSVWRNGFVLTHENLNENGEFEVATPSCSAEHADWLLCDDCKKWALAERLLAAETRSNDELTFLESDYKKYCNIWYPARLSPTTKHRTELQNYVLRNYNHD